MRAWLGLAYRQLRVLDRLYHYTLKYNVDPDCNHYVIYGAGGGYSCVRCNGFGLIR